MTVRSKPDSEVKLASHDAEASLPQGQEVVDFSADAAARTQLEQRKNRKTVRQQLAVKRGQLTRCALSESSVGEDGSP